MPENRSTPYGFNFRMDADLKERVAEAAKRSLRTMQKEIEYRLRRSFEQSDNDNWHEP